MRLVASRKILRTITVNAATLLGVDKQVGDLAVGKSADIVAVAGDPLADPLLGFERQRDHMQYRRCQ
jgi:imidazolonepropionase-like amidohydrolase